VHRALPEHRTKNNGKTIQIQDVQGNWHIGGASGICSH
jgi:hypothetical protein